jgi:hypothetical protein
MRETFTSGSVGRAPGNRCLYPEPDCQKPTLVPRCGFRQQVSASVDMTSDVKSWVEIRSTFSSFLLFSERYCPSEEPEPVKYDG